METNIIQLIQESIRDPNKITIKKAQEITGFSYIIINRAIHNKKLPATKYGKEYKINLQDLYNWVNNKFEPRNKIANNSQ